MVRICILPLDFNRRGRTLLMLGWGNLQHIIPRVQTTQSQDTSPRSACMHVMHLCILCPITVNSAVCTLACRIQCLQCLMLLILVPCIYRRRWCS